MNAHLNNYGQATSSVNVHRVFYEQIKRVYKCSFCDSVMTVVNELMGDSGVMINFNCHKSADEDLSRKARFCLYSIIQEQLENIFSHAAASSVNINFFQQKEEYILSFADNGQGFDSQNITKGTGLRIIHSRAKLFGGVMRCISQPGHGCSVIIRFPVKCLASL